MTFDSVKYSVVESWFLDLDHNEIDHRQHGFAFLSHITDEERVALISNTLGTRMWCDIDSEYVNKDEFLPCLYDNAYIIEN